MERIPRRLFLEKRPCSKCNEFKARSEFYRLATNSDGLRSECKQCGLKRQRAWYYEKGGRENNLPSNRKSKRNRYRNDPLERVKEKARDAVTQAVKKGRLKKTACAVCGEAKVQGHHPDYTKPLEVAWLCDWHHRQEHKRMREQKPAAVL